MTEARVDVTGHFATRVHWPTGHQPYNRTIRAWYYRTHYWLPRIGMWLYVTLPPVALTAWLLPLTASTPVRLAVEIGVIAAAVFVAGLLDLSLYAPIFHGRAQSPGICDAPEIAENWRRDWQAFESRPGETPSILLSLHNAHQTSVPNFDSNTFAASPTQREAFERAVREGFTKFQIKPLFGIGFTSDYRALLIVWPLPEPNVLNGTVWVVVHMLNIAQGDSCLVHSGFTYWYPSGRYSGFGWYRGDAATLKYTLPLTNAFSMDGLFSLIVALVTVALWPIGVLVLIVRAFGEAATHTRYAEFLRTASPRFGDSLDLALITKAAQEDTLMGGRPHVETWERLSVASRQFHEIIAGALLSGMRG